MQAIVGEQDRRWGARLTAESPEAALDRQACRLTVTQLGRQDLAVSYILDNIRMLTLCQRKVLVEESLGEGDDLGTANRIVGPAFLRAALVGDDVCAVERVIEAAPPGVHGSQRVAGVLDRHHQLWA